jgi:hypothetical protein
MIDFSQTKFRASSWGNLLAESKTKGEVIGKTCAGELIKIYNRVMYNRKKDIVTKQMEKGKAVEDDSIKLYSMVEGKIYYKNEDPLENEYFTGHPDIFLGDNIQNAEEVDDIKSSWELDTFMPKLIDGIDKAYEAQLNVYYDLTGAKGGNLVYCLVSAPQNLVEAEKKKLLYNMDVISEISPEYLRVCEELERGMIFDDIDYRERVIKIPIPRNEELIQKMKDKVPVLRNWLNDFHEKHMNLYPKN